MKKLLLLLFIPFSVYSQINVQDQIKKITKFSTFYAAYNGNNSISDVINYSVTDGFNSHNNRDPI